MLIVSFGNALPVWHIVDGASRPYSLTPLRPYSPTSAVPTWRVVHMTGGSFDPDESFDTAAADRATAVRGLKILFWAGCAAIVVALLWPIVRGWLAPAVVLVVAAFALWRLRRFRAMKAVQAWFATLAAWTWER